MIIDKLSDLVDIAQIQNLADAHYKAAGMPIGIIDAGSGAILAGTGWQDICVQFHRAHPVSAKHCMESDRRIRNHILDGSPYAYKCRNGLWDIGIPILVDGVHLATLFLGQFLYEGESSDRNFFIRQAEQFGYEITAYLDALDRIPVFNREKVNNILDYNVAFAGFIADLAQKKQRLCRELGERKRTEEALRKAHDELDFRVRERTAELAAANEALKVEIAAREQVEEELRQSRQHLRNILDNTVALVGVMTPDGTLIEVNRTALDVANLNSEDVLGKPFEECYWWAWSPEIQQQLRGAIDRAARGQTTRYDVLNRVGEGRYIEVDFTLAPLFGPDGKVAYLIPSAVDITERKQAEEELRSLPARLLAAQEEERKRIAHELHDSIGGSLSAVAFSLQNTLALARSNASLFETMENLFAMVQETRDEARRIYANLRPSILDDLGVTATIGWFTRQFQEIYSGIRVKKQIQVEEEDIPESLKIVIFRIIQEAFHNIAKYSNANLVTVSLSQKNDLIELVIADNGMGFDMRSTCKIRKDKGGLGLASMKERVQLSGGTFAIESVPGDGTTVRASWNMRNLT